MVTAIAEDGYECGVRLLAADGGRVVYSDADRNALFSLSLTDVDFVAASVNRFLAAAATHEAKQAGGLDGVVGDAYAGGAPFARPAALVPDVPPAGQGFVAREEGGEAVLTLPEPARAMLKLGAGASLVCAVLVVAVAAVLAAQHNSTWRMFAVFAVVLASAAWRQHRSAMATDTLTLSPSGWRLVQRRRRTRRSLNWPCRAILTDEDIWDGVLGAKVCGPAHCLCLCSWACSGPLLWWGHLFVAARLRAQTRKGR